MPNVPQISALQAARLILEQAGAPLHYEEITKRILVQGLWQTSGKTPSATVNAHLAVDIKRKGSASAFVRTAPGLYALNATPVGGCIHSEEPLPYLASPSASPSAQHANRLSNTDAAERILETSVSRQLHYREITRLAIDQNLLDPAGKTPEATMYAQILTEVKRRRQRDEPQRFMLLGKGMVSLAKWQASGIAYQVDEANKQARDKLLKHVKAMKPYDFENLVSELLLALGFEQVEVTSRSNDGGIDVRGTLVVGDVIRTRLAVQVKRWKSNVQAPVIQQVRGSLGTHEQGLIITTSDFSKGAREEATRANATPVGLMNGEQLVDLLIQNEIGITLTPLQLIQLYTPAAGTV
ncbi:MAG: HTH domain-containing protein [Kiritimatiellae bacterium]|nr:HTH domain-containing protein [Kiritimatiellia bacterium]